jgi:HK97 family phage portal protein
VRFQWPIKFGREAKEALSFDQLLTRMATANQISSGISVTPENAMRCTTVQGIVRALTNAIGSYPVSVGQVIQGSNGPTVKELPTHEIVPLLARPNAVHTSTEFFRMATTHVALWGNFYAIKGQGQTGPVRFLRPIEDPDSVTVEDVHWRNGVTYRVHFKDGAERFFAGRQMLHITSGIPSSDGVTGISPVEKAREAIGICLAAERLIAQLYGNNDVPTMALMGGTFRDEEDYKLWLQKFKEARGQMSEGRGGTLLLPDGMTAKELSFKPVDAQLLEMRKFQRLEIAQVYGVPPHKLADLERATFSNIEEQSLEFVRDVAAPWVKLFSQAMARDLLSEEDQKSGHVIRFDMEAATEGKLADRLSAYGKAHEIGAMSPNEIRQRLGMNPRTDPGGDEYVTPLNMRPSNELPRTSEDEGTDREDEELGSEGAPNSLRAVR